MNCTKHFLERWTERIVGVSGEKEIREYVGQNRQQIEEHANKSFEFSEFIYKGQIGDNITRNFYIKDDMIFIANTSDDALITVYKVDLGFPEDLNTQVRKGLLEEIKSLQGKKSEVDLEAELTVLSKKHEAESIQQEIELLEEKISNLKFSKRTKEEEIKELQKSSSNLELDIKRYTINLVNSLEFKRDLQSMK